MCMCGLRWVTIGRADSAGSDKSYFCSGAGVQVVLLFEFRSLVDFEIGEDLPLLLSLKVTNGRF